MGAVSAPIVWMLFPHMRVIFAHSEPHPCRGEKAINVESLHARAQKNAGVLTPLFFAQYRPLCQNADGFTLRSAHQGRITADALPRLPGVGKCLSVR